jgi:membrane protein DedA with SNARE-associated domain
MPRMTIENTQMIKNWQPVVLFCIIFLMAAQPAAAADPHASGYTLRYSLLAASAPINGVFMRIMASATVDDAGHPSNRAIASFAPLPYFLNGHVGPMKGMDLALTMALIALATLISEDLACISAGLMAARGTIGLFPAVMASFAGILIGDILLYLAGRYFGQPALARTPLKWVLKKEEVAKAAHWFSAKGPIIIITSRFLPGSRLPTYFSAGMLGTGFWRFTIYFGVAAALWTPILVCLSALAGNRMFEYYDTFKSYGMMIVVATVLLIWLALKLVIPAFSFRGRRLLLSSFRRLTRWEFWPPPIFYLPVAIYILFLGFKHKSLTLFTAANPGMPDGGFIEGSKSQILDHLGADRRYVARFELIRSDLPVAAKISLIEDFMLAIGKDFPVVLKPDVGERGAGVAIIGTEQQLAEYLARAAVDCIVQEFVDGFEYGVFYYRYPHEPTGRLFSITDKRLLTVTGDGRSTLEELILGDDRAVCMAPFHFNNHREQLFTIPRPGEIFRLAEIGTHRRGKLFLDGRTLQTPDLISAIDTISKRYDGFFFGRYDIRTPSIEDFRRGMNFKIVALNGVTSEATHIYHPGNSIWSAYRTLMRQWELAFDIGAANFQRGIPPSPPRKLLNRVLKNVMSAGKTRQNLAKKRSI